MDISYPFISEKDAVLERLGGNEALLGKLLLKFRDNYLNTRQELMQLLESGNHEEAYRLVHSIKGVSANLGIGKLYCIAISLENRMKADDWDGLMGEVMAFLEEIDGVVSALE